MSKKSNNEDQVKELLLEDPQEDKKQVHKLDVEKNIRFLRLRVRETWFKISLAIN